MAETNYFLGIDIGGTNIKSVVLSEMGNILWQSETPTLKHHDTPTPWLDQVKEIVDQTTKEFTKRPTEKISVGIAAPGLVDEGNTKILTMPIRLKGLENMEFSKHLDREVWVLNDGHSACLAEYETHYKKEGIQNFIMLTLGTGVGGAAIINGKIYQGQFQRAGHFGHMSINHHGEPITTNMVGSLEYAMGDFSVEKRTYGKFSSTKDLVNAYLNGDTLACYWWLDSVQKLATALASLINILSPECIVLGGGIASGAKEALFDPLDEFISLYEWQPNGTKVPIVAAKNKGFSGAIGAAYFSKLKC